MPKYHIWTIGCQMNKADSDHVAGFLERAGFHPAPSEEEADFVLVNSCVVRDSAEQKVRNKLTSLKGLKKRRPDTTIAVTGCLVDSRMEALAGEFPWVDLFFQPQQWEVLSNWADAGGLPQPKSKECDLKSFTPVSAYVPIVHGCNSFCSYCIVPYRRGRERSRTPEDIRQHVESLVQRGAREVTLLGQNVGSYGKNLPGRPDLADLLAEINTVQGLLRIRFLTQHPRDMSHRLIEAMASLDKVCESISLPIQAGDDAILKAMRRGYTTEQYEETVARLRSSIPQIAISSDIIVGFPNETHEQFQKTIELLHRLRFDRVHVARYSPRPGTLASRTLPDNVPDEEKWRRRREADAVHQAIAAEINARLVGQSIEVLVEGRKKDKWWGRSRGDKLVFLSGEGHLEGQLVTVKIDKATAWALQGQQVMFRAFPDSGLFPRRRNPDPPSTRLA